MLSGLVLGLLLLANISAHGQTIDHGGSGRGYFRYGRPSLEHPKHARLDPGDIKRGFLGTIGLGVAAPTSQKNYDGGGGGQLGLGYGFDARSSVWLTTVVADVDDAGPLETNPGFAGIEIGFKYSLRPEWSVRPYGRFGVGGYALVEDKTDRNVGGYGLNLAFGAECLLTRHFGLGAEWQFKNISYTRESLSDGGDFESLDRDIVGDMAAFMVTLTAR